MIRLFLLLLVLLTPVKAKATDNINLSEWKTLPVLHEGRVKPLDSFARIYLKIYSGYENIEDVSASEWLAETLFTPEKAITRKLFKGRNDDGKAFALTYEELSSFIRARGDIIQALLDVPPEDWSLSQQNLMDLYENYILHTQLLRAMTVFVMNEEDAGALTTKLKKIIARKGNDLEKYTEEEKEIAARSYALTLISEGAKNNLLFTVIRKDDDWLSPWEASRKEINPAPLAAWENMTRAYRANDQARWDQAVAAAKDNSVKLKIETLFNKISLHYIAELFYGLAILLFMLSFFVKPALFEKTAFYALITGVLLNVVHIMLRVYILGRPPIGTLYESVLFVAAVCALGYAFMAWKQKNSNHILLGGVSGFLLLITAEFFAAEDTMGTLVAVLNTDFWLITHVICITLGYGVCLLTSLTAHYALFQNAVGKIRKGTVTTIKTLSLFSLLLVTVGTILGGLWADQSWGRFWGWDPKENGALLIVLWLIWIIHGQLTGHINRNGFLVGSAFLSVIVVLAWFGVNLLNVGLHSYGFISGVAWGIGLFCAFEVILISALWLIPKWKNKRG